MLEAAEQPSSRAMKAADLRRASASVSPTWPFSHLTGAELSASIAWHDIDNS